MNHSLSANRASSFPLQRGNSKIKTNVDRLGTRTVTQNNIQADYLFRLSSAIQRKERISYLFFLHL